MPGNPILIIVPSGITSTVSSRQHKWAAQLGSLGTVAAVQTHLGLAANRMTMLVCMDQLVQATRAKIQDVRSDSPGRPIILVGFNTGAALACQVKLNTRPIREMSRFRARLRDLLFFFLFSFLFLHLVACLVARPSLSMSNSTAYLR